MVHMADDSVYLLVRGKCASRDEGRSLTTDREPAVCGNEHLHQQHESRSPLSRQQGRKFPAQLMLIHPLNERNATLPIGESLPCRPSNCSMSGADPASKGSDLTSVQMLSVQVQRV
jgi:hypothetical protein